ncbi:MAG: aspartate/glutamate racemase family protein [Alphaproteobacteria bacterium]|nr:aspartate/glutamate racemase family protein [Alphaproteobacteria bacterium]
MAPIRIGVLSPVDVAFPAVKNAFAELWPEAQTVCLLDESLYADFVNSDYTVDPQLPEEAYARIADLFRYSRKTGADGIIFCGSVFGALVEAGREGLDIPVLTSFEGMIEAAFAEGPRLGIVTSADSSLRCLSDDVDRYAQARDLDYTIVSEIADGAFQKVVAGDRDGADQMIVDAAASVTECDSLMLGQFSMGSAVGKIAKVPGRPVLTAPQGAVEKLKRLLDG